MALKQKAWSSPTGGEEGTWEPPPAENQPAMLVGVIDLGTHPSEFQGETRDRPLVYLVWELTTARKSGTTANHTIGQLFTNSFHKKAGLRAMVEKLLKRQIPDGEEFDLRTLFSVPCFVDVKVKEITTRKGDQRTVANWDGCSQPPRGTSVPPATVEPLYWELEPGKALPNAPWLPLLYGKTVADKIKESNEWRAFSPAQQAAAQPTGTTAPPRPAQTPASAPPAAPARASEPPAGSRQRAPSFNPMTADRFWVETVEDGVREMGREELKTLVDAFEEEARADAHVGVMDFDKKCGEWKTPSYFGITPNPF